MRCETCQGTGKTMSRAPFGDPAKDLYTCTMIACPECGGSGVTHCCDGMREQPDGARDAALRDGGGGG